MKYSPIVTNILMYSFVLTIITFSLPSNAEQKKDLQSVILVQDKQLFDVGFNQCDFDTWDRVFGKEFEFYDDRSGLNKDRQREVRSFQERCSNTPGLKRHLVNSRVSSLGSGHALQLGEHEFVLNGKTVERAKFIHVWALINNEWVVSRVISYDHEPVKILTSTE